MTCRMKMMTEYKVAVNENMSNSGSSLFRVANLEPLFKCDTK